MAARGAVEGRDEGASDGAVGFVGVKGEGCAVEPGEGDAEQAVRGEARWRPLV